MKVVLSFASPYCLWRSSDPFSIPYTKVAVKRQHFIFHTHNWSQEWVGVLEWCRSHPKPMGSVSNPQRNQMVRWNIPGSRFELLLGVIPPTTALIDRSRRNALHRLPTAVRLETAMVPTVNMGWPPFTNDKYWKSFSKLFHVTRRLRLVFQLNDCVFPTDLTKYLSGYIIQWLSGPTFQMNVTPRPYSCWLVGIFLAWASMD